MLRQASYRSLPTVSDCQGVDDEKEVPELEPSSVDLESLMEDEDANMGDEKQLRDRISTFKGSGVYFNHPMADTSSLNDTDHDDGFFDDEDLSCGSVEFDIDNDIEFNDNESDLLNLGNSNLSTIIDDFIKDDYFSSSEEEEEYFIEEKRDLRNGRLQLYKAYSEPVMTISHYSLHTIDEEGSVFNDDCSVHSKGLDKTAEQTNIKQFSIPLEKTVSLQRSRSAPTPSNQYGNEVQNQESHKYNNQCQHGGLSLELLSYFSKESDSSGACFGTSSNYQQSFQPDIETQEIQEEHGVSKSPVRRKLFQKILLLSLILFVLMTILIVIHLILP